MTANSQDNSVDRDCSAAMLKVLMAFSGSLVGAVIAHILCLQFDISNLGVAVGAVLGITCTSAWNAFQMPDYP